LELNGFLFSGQDPLLGVTKAPGKDLDDYLQIGDSRLPAAAQRD